MRACANRRIVKLGNFEAPILARSFPTCDNG
jgi:hypothetical protein